MEEKNIMYKSWDKEGYAEIGGCEYLCSVCKHRLSELAYEKGYALTERCQLPRCEAYPEEKPEELKGDKKVSEFAECDKFEKGLLIKTKLQGDRIASECGDGFFVFKELARDYGELDENTSFEDIIKQRIESAKKLANGTR